jgi:transposase
MLYVGLDIHSKLISMCVLDENGKRVERRVLRQVDQLMAALERLPQPFEVCFEASCGYGRFDEWFRPLAARVVVAHPGRLALIFRSQRKNDRNDAENLAKLLLLGIVPAVHVPSADVRSWRELITFRRKVIEKRTRAKNALRGLLRTVGVTPPKRPGLWTRAGLRWLKALEFSQPLQALRRDLLVDELEQLSAQVRRIERELNRFSNQSVAVAQLRSIPGVGPRTAEAVVAFLDDPHRFARSKQVGAYFGLVPSQDQSAGTNRLGHITREGSATVRQLLTEAVWQAARRSPTVQAYLQRVQRSDPDRKKIAVVATAHYLVRVMWALLKHGTLWKETLGSTAARSPRDPEAGGQARPTVSAAPPPGQTRRSRKRSVPQTPNEPLQEIIPQT